MATVSIQSPEISDRRRKFFDILFDREGVEGYVCIARGIPKTADSKNAGRFEEQFFEWPKNIPEMMSYIERSVVGFNLWFCPMTFSRPQRSKYEVLSVPALWADLDACPPGSLLVPPTILLETSIERHQGLWCLKDLAEPLEAETVTKAIAYKHADEGADKSGWDLTQLLRVPFSLNYKYSPEPMVNIVAAGEVLTLPYMQEMYPRAEENSDNIFPFPEKVMDGEKLLKAYANILPSRAWQLLRVPPEKDWSKALWSLQLLLAEAGLGREEMFAIVKTAACNKYARDGRNDSMLWKEVCRAWTKHRERSIVIQDAVQFKNPDLLTPGEVKDTEQDVTFIDEYVGWAKSVGDASEVYHHAGAFIALSSLMSGSVQLPTSFGVIVPNLWFLLLADTTLTRKSTALDLAVDMLVEVNPELIMATDGSIEGIFTSLSLRPNQPSIFLRDEFSGMLEMMSKRDYYAGMAESLTKMYDGKLQRRVLRRETIEVKDPILIMFAGGIKTKILQLLTSEQITSGFLPRFIFVAGMSDVSKLRPLGPPVADVTTGRDQLVRTMRQFNAKYRSQTTITMDGVELQTKNKQPASLSPEAWTLYNEMERKLLETGITAASQELLTPVMDRLAKSGLKAAVLIAASRMPERVVVEERDIFKAFSFVTQWRQFAMDVVSNIGLPQQERLIIQIYEAILKNPNILRSTLMTRYHLVKREADIIFDTLEQRGQIERVKAGRSERLKPLDEE